MALGIRVGIAFGRSIDANLDHHCAYDVHLYNAYDVHLHNGGGGHVPTVRCR